MSIEEYLDAIQGRQKQRRAELDRVKEAVKKAALDDDTAAYTLYTQQQRILESKPLLSDKDFHKTLDGIVKAARSEATADETELASISESLQAVERRAFEHERKVNATIQLLYKAQGAAAAAFKYTHPGLAACQGAVLALSTKEREHQMDLDTASAMIQVNRAAKALRLSVAAVLKSLQKTANGDRLDPGEAEILQSLETAMTTLNSTAKTAAAYCAALAMFNGFTMPMGESVTAPMGDGDHL